MSEAFEAAEPQAVQIPELAKPVDASDQERSHPALHQMKVEEGEDRRKELAETERAMDLALTVGGEVWSEPQFERQGNGVENPNTTSANLGLVVRESPQSGSGRIWGGGMEYARGVTPSTKEDARLSAEAYVGYQIAGPKGWSFNGGGLAGEDLVRTIDVRNSTQLTVSIGEGSTVLDFIQARRVFWDLPTTGVFVGFKAPNGLALQVTGKVNPAMRYAPGATIVWDGKEVPLVYANPDGTTTPMGGDDRPFSVKPQYGIGVQLTIPIQRL